MFDKRGVLGVSDKIIFLAVEILIIGFLAVALGFYVHTVANDSTYWRTYYAVDTALTLDMAKATQGNIIVNYGIKKLPYPLTFEFMEQYVKVYQGAIDPNNIPIFYYHAKDSKITFQNNNIIDTFFSINKEASNLFVSNTVYLPAETCNSIQTSDDLKKIKFSVFTDDAQFSKDVKTVLKSFIETNTNKLEEDETKADMIIIIASKNTDEISIISSDKLSFVKSEKLGCIILNKILANYQKDKSSQSKYSEKDYDIEILKKVSSDKVAVGIVVGNKNQKNPSEFARFIFEAINEYYK